MNRRNTRLEQVSSGCTSLIVGVYAAFEVGLDYSLGVSDYKRSGSVFGGLESGLRRLG